MQVVQRRVLERVALLIGWNRDDDGSVDLADGELAALKTNRNRERRWPG
jgi:hypothetical protein